MAKNVDPLNQRTPIVDSEGRPTLAFLTQWFKQITQNVGSAADFASLQTQLTALLARNINTTGGLQGGGNLSADRTLSLTDVGAAGTFGNATNVPQLTVDAKGRITSITLVPITAGGAPWFFNPPTLATLSTAVTEGPSVASIVETDDPDVGLSMAATFTQGDNALLRLTTLGSLPKTVTARTLMTANGFLSRGFGGICLRNSSTGQRIIFGTRTAQPGLWGSRQATGVAFDSEFTVTPHIQNMDALWVRIVIDAAGNGSLQISADGKQFREYFSRTAAQMAGAGVDQVGLGLTYGDFGFADLAMSCQYFNVT